MSDNFSPEADQRRPAATASLIALILIAIFLDILGPLLGIFAGVLWSNPNHEPSRQRDGNVLLILCTLLLFVQAVSLGIAMSRGSF